MTIIAFFLISAFYFLVALQWIIMIDIFLSWLGLVGIFVRIPFFGRTLDHIYMKIRQYVPTTFGMIDFTPFFLLLGIYFLMDLIQSFFL